MGQIWLHYWANREEGPWGAHPWAFEAESVEEEAGPQGLLGLATRSKRLATLAEDGVNARARRSSPRS